VNKKLLFTLKFFFVVLLASEPLCAQILPSEQNAFDNPQNFNNPMSDSATDIDDEYHYFHPYEDRVYGDRSITINSYSPLEGFVDIMTSPLYANQIPTYLAGPMSLSLIALNLTEPAVGAGITSAMQHVNQSVQSRYLAEQQFIQQAKANPESSQMIIEAYNRCVYKHMSSRGGMEMGWVQAQSKCLTERTTPQAVPFAVAGGSGFTFFDLPEHVSNNPLMAQDPDELLQNRISVVDYLFNLALTDWVPPLASTSVPPTLPERKASFIRNFGNVLLELPDAVTGSLSGGAREVNVRRKLPTVSPYEEHANLRRDNYHVILSMMYQQCVDYTIPFAGAHDAFSHLKPDRRGFWIDEDRFKDQIRELSIPGFQINPIILDALYRLYEERKPEMPQNVTDCNSLSPFGEHHQPGSWEFTGFKPSKYHRAYLILADRLATAQIFLRFDAAMRFVESLPASSNVDSLVRKYAIQLVQSTAKTDIPSAYMQNLQALRDWADQRFAVLASETGKRMN